MEWQPIETAPIGVDVLFYSPDSEIDWAKRAIGQIKIIPPRNKWQKIKSVVLFRVGNQLLKRATAVPTHWMPLPEPPKG